MSVLDSKVPPPIVMVAVGGLMWAAERALPFLRFPGEFPASVAIGVAAVGLAVEVLGAASFVRARTTVDPTHPCSASKLVTTGVYRFTRNPMYLGDLVMLVGWALYLSNVLALVLVPLFVAYIDRFQIRPEEAAMSDLFGEDYSEFTSRVRRWI